MRKDTDPMNSMTDLKEIVAGSATTSLLELLQQPSTVKGVPPEVLHQLRAAAEQIEREHAEQMEREQAARTEVEQTRQMLQQKETALRETEERFRAVCDNARAAVGILVGTRLVYANRYFSELTGYSNEEILALDFRQMTHPSFHHVMIERARKRLAGEPVPNHYEFLAVTKSGEMRWIDFSPAPTLLNGQPVIIGTGFDVTEHKQAEEEIRQLNTQLEQRVEERTAELAAANRELEAFGYTVSHDLRTPLRHVTGFVELLNDHAAASLDEEGKLYLKTIGDSAARMANLIDDLLTLSRLGRATLTISNVDLRQLVEEARLELAPLTHGRTIEWQISPLPQVRGDRTLLRNAVVNLVSNAIKYTSNRNPARIEIGAEQRAGEVVCFVRDNGAGFDMRFVDKLFGVFQRLHPQEQFEGTGIGLASVRRIVERHGGRVWAQGTVDQGATFFVALPVKTDLDGHPSTAPCVS